MPATPIARSPPVPRTKLRTPLASFSFDCIRTRPAALAAPTSSGPHALGHFGHPRRQLFSCLGESSSALTAQRVDLVQLAATVAEEFWAAEETRRRLDLRIDESGVVPCRGDLDSIAIALRNLIENALRYSRGAQVEIRVEAPCTVVEVHIAEGATVEGGAKLFTLG